MIAEKKKGENTNTRAKIESKYGNWLRIFFGAFVSPFFTTLLFYESVSLQWKILLASQ